MPPCEHCQPDQGWPFPAGTGATQDDNPTRVRLEDSEDLEDDWTPMPLASGTATLTAKMVSVCNEKYYVDGKYKYPAFPKNADWPWENIENGEWDSISRYWGNASADCSDWTTAQLSKADKDDIGNGHKVRSHYESKQAHLHEQEPY